MAKKDRLFQIGRFSRMTSLTVKTLRHYAEKGVLVPSYTDPDTGYRYYDGAALEKAQAIASLRELDIGLETIKAIIADCNDDMDALDYLQGHRGEIAAKLAHYRAIDNALGAVIGTLREQQAMQERQSTAIEDKQLPSQLIAGIRQRGSFGDMGQSFKRLGRACGFAIGGKAGSLFYDTEYKEKDADFEPFFPLKKPKELAGINVRELPGGRFLCLEHHGPYETISNTYRVLLAEIARRGLAPLVPSREVYLRGPGMIFKGNPKRYITEVQIPVEAPKAGLGPPQADANQASAKLLPIATGVGHFDTLVAREPRAPPGLFRKCVEVSPSQRFYVTKRPHPRAESHAPSEDLRGDNGNRREE